MAAGEAATAASFVQVVPHAELGFVGVTELLYRSGPAETATLPCFVTQGGRGARFPYQRYSVELVLGHRHRMTFRYQPLTVNTRTEADRHGASGVEAVPIDDATFAPATAMAVTHGFHFWRLS